MAWIETFPWNFTVFTFITSALVLWYLLYASKSLAIILELGLSPWMGKDRLIRVGSVNFAFLGGKIYFHDVTYISKNAKIEIVSASFSFKWWHKNIRTLENKEFPVRLLVHVVGMRVSIHANSSKYDLLQSLFDKGSIAQEDVSVVMNDIEEELSDEIPFFYRWSPVTKIVLQQTFFVLTNPHLPTNAALAIKAFEAFHFPVPSGETTRYVVSGEAVGTSLAFVDNLNYKTPSEARSDFIKMNKNFDQEDIFTIAASGVRNFITQRFNIQAEDIPFISRRFRGNGQQNEERPKKDEQVQSQLFDLPGGEKDDPIPHPFRTKSNSSDPKETTDRPNILVVKKLSFEYFFESPTKVKELHDWEVDPPLQGLNLCFQSLVQISYGPWADFQRFLIYS